MTSPPAPLLSKERGERGEVKFNGTYTYLIYRIHIKIFSDERSKNIS